MCHHPLGLASQNGVELMPSLLHWALFFSIDMPIWYGAPFVAKGRRQSWKEARGFAGLIGYESSVLAEWRLLLCYDTWHMDILQTGRLVVAKAGLLYPLLLICCDDFCRKSSHNYHGLHEPISRSTISPTQRVGEDVWVRLRNVLGLKWSQLWPPFFVIVKKEHIHLHQKFTCTCIFCLLGIPKGPTSDAISYSIPPKIKFVLYF